MSSRAALRRVQDRVLAPEAIYRVWLKGIEGARLPPNGDLVVPRWCATLKSEGEWRAAIADSRRLGLPLHPDPPKNWDTRIAVAALLASTGPDEFLLDAGAETYSRILGTLYAYGRRNLVGINLTFPRPAARGPLRFEWGDITRTRFDAGSFAGIACQSVVEHGVDLDAFFAEMARLLRPGGVLVVSTDYYPTAIDTLGQMAFGVPIRIFTRDDMLRMLDAAAAFGLEPTHEVDLECEERPIWWREFDLRYTFTCVTLRKVAFA